MYPDIYSSTSPGPDFANPAVHSPRSRHRSVSPIGVTRSPPTASPRRSVTPPTPGNSFQGRQGPRSPQTPITVEELQRTLRQNPAVFLNQLHRDVVTKNHVIINHHQHHQNSRKPHTNCNEEDQVTRNNTEDERRDALSPLPRPRSSHHNREKSNSRSPPGLISIKRHSISNNSRNIEFNSESRIFHRHQHAQQPHDMTVNNRTPTITHGHKFTGANTIPHPHAPPALMGIDPVVIETHNRNSANVKIPVQQLGEVF